MPIPKLPSLSNLAIWIGVICPYDCGPPFQNWISPFILQLILVISLVDTVYWAIAKLLARVLPVYSLPKTATDVAGPSCNCKLVLVIFAEFAWMLTLALMLPFTWTASALIVSILIFVLSTTSFVSVLYCNNGLLVVGSEFLIGAIYNASAVDPCKSLPVAFNIIVLSTLDPE